MWACVATGGDQAALMKAMQEQLEAQRRASQQLEAELEAMRFEGAAATEQSSRLGVRCGERAKLEALRRYPSPLHPLGPS